MKNLQEQSIMDRFFKDSTGDLPFEEQVNLYAEIVRDNHLKLFPGHVGRVAYNMVDDGLIDPNTMQPIPEAVDSFFDSQYDDSLEGTSFAQ